MPPARALLRVAPRISCRLRQQTPVFATASRQVTRAFTSCLPRYQAGGPPNPPAGDSAEKPFLGTTKRLSEFNLSNKVVLVSGAARGLGLTQAEALLEAGAIGMPWLNDGSSNQLTRHT